MSGDIFDRARPIHELALKQLHKAAEQYGQLASGDYVAGEELGTALTAVLHARLVERAGGFEGDVMGEDAHRLADEVVVAIAALIVNLAAAMQVKLPPQVEQSQRRRVAVWLQTISHHAITRAAAVDAGYCDFVSQPVRNADGEIVEQPFDFRDQLGRSSN